MQDRCTGVLGEIQKEKYKWVEYRAFKLALKYFLKSFELWRKINANYEQF